MNPSSSAAPSVQPVMLTDTPTWRLEVEVGRAGCDQLPEPEPRYVFRLETSAGPRVFECDYQTLGKLKKELQASLETLRSSAQLTGKRS